MPPVKELSNDLKLRIVKCLNDRMPQRKVSLLLQCGRSTVWDILKKYRSANSEENHLRSGRPRATSKQLDRKLIRFTQSMRHSTLKQLNTKWSKYQVNVCDRTVTKIGLMKKVLINLFSQRNIKKKIREQWWKKKPALRK